MARDTPKGKSRNRGKRIGHDPYKGKGKSGRRGRAGTRTQGRKRNRTKGRTREKAKGLRKSKSSLSCTGKPMILIPFRERLFAGRDRTASHSNEISLIFFSTRKAN